jgi:hypothetical protein
MEDEKWREKRSPGVNRMVVITGVNDELVKKQIRKVDVWVYHEPNRQGSHVECLSDNALRPHDFVRRLPKGSYTDYGWTGKP